MARPRPLPVTSVWFSRDNGETFSFQELDSPWQYTRTIVPRADGDKTVFLTNGNGPPGSTGRLLRSTDHGQSFSLINRPDRLSLAGVTALDNGNLILVGQGGVHLAAATGADLGQQ